MQRRPWHGHDLRGHPGVDQIDRLPHRQRLEAVVRQPAGRRVSCCLLTLFYFVPIQISNLLVNCHWSLQFSCNWPSLFLLIDPSLFLWVGSQGLTPTTSLSPRLREEGTRLRSTGPRSARPCWIGGPQQQDSSDDRAAMHGTGGLGNNQHSIYSSGRP